MLERGEYKEYLPIDGLAAFKKATATLLLGAGNPALSEGRVATLQSLSGTGSLRVGAAFLHKFLPDATIYLPNPTWGNHKNVFTDAGCAIEYYSHFDPATIGLDFAGLMEDLEAAPDGSVIILHGCAHNPTGVDPTKEQWAQIADLIKRKRHLPFFDVAYQGFATGDLDEDAYAPRFFVEQGLECFVAQSYSKNLGLYAERVGAMNYIGVDSGVATKVLSQMKRIARGMYSNPPVHGARIVAEVVETPELFEIWRGEMSEMAGRIAGVRSALKEALEKRDSSRDWGFVTRQIGMFSFTGLSKKQVENMTNKHHVYMTFDGRISLAGLNMAKVDFLAEAIIDSFKVPAA